MSERSFSRHYAEATGRTPARAIERLRVEAARRLLSESGLPVKRISLRRSATTDGRSKTNASINSRRLRWRCLFSSGAASAPDITRPRIRAAIGAAFTLGICPTPIPHSRDSDHVEREIESM